MRRIIWRGNRGYLPTKEEVAISFDPSTGFVERDGKLFVVVDLDPETFATARVPKLIGVTVFADHMHEFLQTATDDEIFASQSVLAIQSKQALRPGPNSIKVLPLEPGGEFDVQTLEPGKEYCFVIYAEYPG